MFAGTLLLVAQLAALPPGIDKAALDALVARVQRASGRRMDEYLRDELFAPPGITDFRCETDPAGTPQSWCACASAARAEIRPRTRSTAFATW